MTEEINKMAAEDLVGNTFLRICVLGQEGKARALFDVHAPIKICCLSNQKARDLHCDKEQLPVMDIVDLMSTTQSPMTYTEEPFEFAGEYCSPWYDCMEDHMNCNFESIYHLVKNNVETLFVANDRGNQLEQLYFGASWFAFDNYLCAVDNYYGCMGTKIRSDGTNVSHDGHPICHIIKRQ